MLQRLRQLLSEYPFFLYLAPLFFIYHGYNELFGQLPLLFVLTQALMIQAGVLLLFILLRMVVRNVKATAVATLLLSVWMLMFGFIHDELKSSTLPYFMSRYLFLLPITGMLILLVVVWLRRSVSVNWQRHYLFLNLLLLILFITEVPSSFQAYKKNKETENLIDARFSAFHQYQSKITTSFKPDIFFLVFDAMASSKSLQETMQFDNSQLDSFLTQTGFRIIPYSTANYNSTILSVSSILNMDYLPGQTNYPVNDAKCFFQGAASFLDNSLTRILKQENYRSFQYQPVSFYNADWPYPTFFASLKNDHFFFKTLPGRIYRDVFWNYMLLDLPVVKRFTVAAVNNRHLARKKEMERTIQLIKQTCGDTSIPKFVYGHFILPHDPYSFDAEGRVKTVTETDLQINNQPQEESKYLEQVQYANRIIKDLVLHIQKNNKPNTVIIVAGDHGYKYFQQPQSVYSFSNLNALYFPDADYQMLSDSLTMVNSFRILLNKYFGSSYPLLKDSNFSVTPGGQLLPAEKSNRQLIPAHSKSGDGTPALRRHM